MHSSHTVRWRFLDTGAGSAFFNMALDEVIAESVRIGDAAPTLRFYQFSTPAITLGYHQNVTEENLDRCRAGGVEVVRRPTGGRAVFHDADFTYSVCLGPKATSWADDQREIYHRTSLGFLGALSRLGIHAELAGRVRSSADSRLRGHPSCFVSVVKYELLVEKRKILGSAQRRLDGVTLQQGSLLLHDSQARVAEMLGGRSISGTPVTADSVGLDEVMPKPVPLHNLKAVLRESIGRSLGARLIEEGLTAKETRSLAEREAKYRSPTWNLDRS